jgi:hypothetical protein
LNGVARLRIQATVAVIPALTSSDFSALSERSIHDDAPDALDSCISSNPLLMPGSGIVCVIIGSISILPSMRITETSPVAVRSGRRRARHVDEVRDQLAADLFRVDEVRHAEALAPLLLGIVGLDADDNVRACEPQSLDNIEPDTPDNYRPALPNSTIIRRRRAPTTCSPA